MAVATQSCTGTWQKFFPMDIGTEVYSLVFVKKLFAAAVSYVLFTRNVFPNSAFFDKQLEGIKLKILREDKFPESAKVVYWLRGCFDAIDRQYLKSATISLYSQNSAGTIPDKSYESCRIVESYSFKISYGESTIEMNISSNNDILSTSTSLKSTVSQSEIQEATLNLLKNINSVGEKIGKPSGNLFMTMRLQYNEATPDDYVPPGFRKADDVSFEFDGTPANIRIGSVKTAYHNLKMHIQLNQSLLPASKRLDRTNTKSLEEPLNQISNNSQTAQKNSDFDETQDLTDSLQKQTLQSDNDFEETFPVRCPCGINKDDGVMILCDGCGMWQHAVCFRILEGMDVPTSHICEQCSDAKPELLQNGGVTDESLKGQPEDARKSLCLLRRALLLCTVLDAISPAIIAKHLEVKYNVARSLFNRLLDEGVLKSNGSKRGEKVVDKSYLEDCVMPKTFQRPVDVTKGSTSNEPKSSKSPRSVRHTRRLFETLNANESMEIDELMRTSQDSLFSPVPPTKRRKTGIANTPVAILRK